ncbi:MAG: ribonuclease III [Deltaproteobacteria bacterium]|nr:ribonuclease III [Deltaproteobacteria bacterium]
MGSGYRGDIDVPAELFEQLKGALLTKQDKISENNFSDLESVLNYKFLNRQLIETALCHRSFANENEGFSNNERLEFLGDAVLSLVISHMLMTRFPNLDEGALSSIRSTLVNEKKLAEIASGLNLGAFILLGKGESKTDGRHKKSILADTMEAVIAAIYLDGGFEGVFEVLKAHFSPLIDSIPEDRPVFDYKSRIQEMVQNQGLQVPDYSIINELGPDHNKTFEVCLTAFGICTKGRAKSKKAAEQEAAKKAFETLVTARK